MQLQEGDQKLQTLLSLKYSRISAKDMNLAAKAAHNVEHEEGVTIDAESLYDDLQFKIAPTENILCHQGCGVERFKIRLRLLEFLGCRLRLQLLEFQ